MFGWRLIWMDSKTLSGKADQTSRRMRYTVCVATKWSVASGHGTILVPAVFQVSLCQ